MTRRKATRPMTVRCPTCRAPAGEPCRTLHRVTRPVGSLITWGYHDARGFAAEDAAP